MTVLIYHCCKLLGLADIKVLTTHNSRPLNSAVHSTTEPSTSRGTICKKCESNWTENCKILLFVYDESFHPVKVFWEPASWFEGKDCPMTCWNIICYWNQWYALQNFKVWIYIKHVF